MVLELGTVPEWIEAGGVTAGFGATVVHNWRARNRERFTAWPKLLGDLAEMDEDQIQGLVDDSPELCDLVALAWESAARSSNDEKYEFLAAAAASALNRDLSELDEEQMYVATLVDLEAHHVQVMVLLGSPRRGTGQLQGQEVIGGLSLDDLKEHWRGKPMLLLPIVRTLERHGLVQTLATYDALEGREPWSLSDFGRGLLTFIKPDARWSPATGRVESSAVTSDGPWDRREGVILRAIARAEETGEDVDAAARQALELEWAAYGQCIRRLADDNMLDAAIMNNGAGEIHAVRVRRILPAGLKAIGAWA